ncbi:GNAT family N-acetyltransferase [Streptomyces sp. 5-8]|uniref:GNAT family N-acetyltransferase n=1 Tax=Streptomyces musisoli TaxID=2802280 RepID=A0ABS1P295_9ACTN|nr:GNAT family N-acetyltransferase [Streptomyces musisoli]MBL1106438.1 GNAT family N-acetyltransferase [Streptomyces musisoli]
MTVVSGPGSPGPAGTGVPHVLDNPARAALTGPHAHFAERRGRVLRYPVDVSPWLALPDEPDEQDWADLAALAGPGADAPLPGFCGEVPADWEITFRVEGVQLVDDGLAAAPDAEAVRLGPADVPDMLDLVARTRPGPFLPRTVELGTYLGIRRGGALVAMAGERLHPPGWTEISAVCTDPAFRGEGLATRLIRAVAHGIRERGETPFLHTGAANTGAVRLYESLGFRLRRRTAFLEVRTPRRPAGGRAAVPVPQPG